MTLENLLREVLAEAATEAPPPAADRAQRAWTDARRRRRGAVLAAAAAAVLVAGLVAVPVARQWDVGLEPSGPAPTTDPLLPDPPRPPRPNPAPQPPPPVEPLPALPVDGGLVLEAAARTGAYQATSFRTSAGTAVRVAGRAGFVRLPWQQAAVSPTGRVAVVDTTDRTPGGRLGIIDDLAADEIRWLTLPNPVLHPTWSPDGRTVLLTVYKQDGQQFEPRLGWLAVDTTEWTISQQLVEAGEAESPSPGGGQVFDWSPDGRSVLAAVALPGSGQAPVHGLRWWALDGRELRTVRTGDPLDSYRSQPLSPSGRLAPVRLSDGRIAVVDTRTGKRVASPDSTARAVLGWRDEGHLVVEGAAGPVLLALDGATSPYATRTGALFGSLQVTLVRP